MPNYTDNLRLEKPLQSENYNIDVFKRYIYYAAVA